MGCSRHVQPGRRDPRRVRGGPQTAGGVAGETLQMGMPTGTDDTASFEQAIAAGQSIQLAAGDYFIDPLPPLSSGMGIIGPTSQLTRIHRKNGSRPGSLIFAN